MCRHGCKSDHIQLPPQHSDAYFPVCDAVLAAHDGLVGAPTLVKDLANSAGDSIAKESY
jgi:hypothetical protein